MSISTYKPLDGEMRPGTPQATSPENDQSVFPGVLTLTSEGGSFGEDIFSSLLCTFHSKALKYNDKEI